MPVNSLAEITHSASHTGLADEIPVGTAVTTGHRRRAKAKTSLYGSHYDGSHVDGNTSLPRADEEDRYYFQNQSHPHYGRSTSRPRLATRTNSAPLIHSLAHTTATSPASNAVFEDDESRPYIAPVQRSFSRPTPPVTTPPTPRPDHTNYDIDGQDEDEVAGVVGRPLQPFQDIEHSDALPEINIAVIGAESVGKSTFAQNAFNLSSLPNSQAAECRIPINGNTFIVRLLELPIDDIEIDDDQAIGWPDIIDGKVMPKVDGALVLYDVQNRESVEDLPAMLNAISKATLPAVLVSCKCDTPPAERQVDAAVIEYNAKRVMASITTLQTSRLNSDSHKRGVFSLLRTIIQGTTESDVQTASAIAMANRRRAQSNAVRPVSPRPPNLVGHSRASSEHTGGVSKAPRHTRKDSNETAPSHLRPPRDPSARRPPLPTHQDSFLLEESGDDSDSDETDRSSTDEDGDSRSLARTSSASSLTNMANGVTFDDLVDRLLAAPRSKADTKFAAIFLALYRLFAAPCRLLATFINRFDALDISSEPQMTKAAAQLRYLAILEQWVAAYPGDFAHPQTRRRIKVFAARLSETSIFGVATRIIENSIEAIREDDDTNWAFCDADWVDQIDEYRPQRASNASTLVDDPLMMFKQDLSGSTLSEDVSNITSIASNLKLSGQSYDGIEAAQAQAELLQPIPRISITKIQWHALMEFPDEAIARELTRIDWTMFLAIRPRDLVRHVSLTANASVPSSQAGGSAAQSQFKNLTHVNRMIDHFNRLAAWTANYVLLRDKPKHRALMLEKLMRIARKLRELNNYNALGAIIAGLKSTAVYRLAATRELLPPAVGRDWLKLEILMAPSKSHFAYRLAWENSNGERVPYLPLHRRDLATAEEGNKTFIVNDENSGDGSDSTAKINWKKFEIMGDVVIGIQAAQSAPYRNLGTSKGSEAIRKLILDVKLVKDEEDLYERSLQCEATAGSAHTASAKFRDFFKR